MQLPKFRFQTGRSLVLMSISICLYNYIWYIQLYIYTSIYTYIYLYIFIYVYIYIYINILYILPGSQQRVNDPCGAGSSFQVGPDFGTASELRQEGWPRSSVRSRRLKSWGVLLFSFLRGPEPFKPMFVCVCVFSFFLFFSRGPEPTDP